MKGLSKLEVLALRGLRLPAPALTAIQRAGIYCQPAISIEFQQQPRCYVIRGVESGGAVSRFGAYCGFVDVRGGPLHTIQPVATVAVNGLHAAVLSPEFVRVQMFRSEQHCELLLTHHSFLSKEGKTRPALSNSVMFHSAHGRLEWQLWGKDSHLQGMVTAIFTTEAVSRCYRLIASMMQFCGPLPARVVSGCRHAHVAGSARQIDGEQLR